MNTDNIKTIFTDYLKTEKTQYAILINGTWGSGKTYFWKNSLTEISVEIGYKTIYVSLNGISKINALEHLLFIKLLPFIGNQENTKAKNATIFVTNILNNASKYFLKTSLTDIFKDVSVDTFNFSKYVICFDDLERCQIPVKEVLGFINNYVEHKNLKTIILADENNIDESQKGYNNIKEKVIGRVLNFKLNIEETLPQLLKSYKSDNADFYTLLVEQKQFIIDILAEYKQDNLRIISFYLDILEKIFPTFNGVDENYIRELILFSAIITIEFKKGNLKSSDSKNPKGINIVNEHYYSLNLARTIRESPNEKDADNRIKPYVEVFYETYLEKRIDNYYFYSSVYSYILSGYINLSDLENEIKKRYPEFIPTEIQDFRALLNYKFRELTNDDFETLTSNVLNYAKEGKYSIYDYIQIAKFYYYFSNNHLILVTKADIDEIIFEGLEIAKNRRQINDSILENLLHFGDDDPEVTKIKSIVKAIHFEIKKDKYLADSNELIDCLINKDEVALTSIFDKHQFSKELFQYTDNELLFETITKISNKQLFNFTELLESRYRSNNIGEFLYEDFDSLTNLHYNLDKFIKTIDVLQEPKRFLLITLLDTLNKICTHLELTKKK